MRFISVRDLRGKSAQVWRNLSQERDMVVTSNGRPVALLSKVSDQNLEESLAALRRARAMAAVDAIQRRSVKQGLHRMSLREINAIIAKVRKERVR